MSFKLKDGETYRTERCDIASATVIPARNFVDLTSGLVTRATASSTELSWCEKGSADGETVCEVSKGNDFTLVGTGDANFAATDKGLEVDLVVNANVQEIDLGKNTTKVLKVGISETAGVVGSDANIEVKINKPLF